MGKMIAIVDAAIVTGQHFERLGIPFDHSRETAWLQGVFAGRPGREMPTVEFGFELSQHVLGVGLSLGLRTEAGRE